MKIILSNIFNNEIIPDKNFPDYGNFVQDPWKFIYTKISQFTVHW